MYHAILSKKFLKSTTKEQFAALAVSLAMLLNDDDSSKVEGHLANELKLLKNQNLAHKKEIKTCEIYESPLRERHLNKFGEREDSCVCCGKITKDNYKLIHATIDWVAINTEEEDLGAHGMESQGFFRVGNSCAKKFKKEFIFEDNYTQ